MCAVQQQEINRLRSIVREYEAQMKEIADIRAEVQLKKEELGEGMLDNWSDCALFLVDLEIRLGAIVNVYEG